MPRGEADPVIEVAGATDQGRRRDNQDFFLADPATGLFVIADGVGGGQCGDVAAKMAADVLAENVRNGSAPDADLLRDGLRAAHDAIHAWRDSQPHIRKMSCAIVAAILRDGNLTVANVGDCRAYLLQRATLRQLTTDHTVAAMMFAQGYINEQQFAGHHMRHTLTTSCGGSRKLDVALSSATVGPADRIVLCSDGVSDVLSSRQLLAIVAKDGSAQQLADELVHAAVSSTGKDNATAIVVCRCRV